MPVKQGRVRVRVRWRGIAAACLFAAVSAAPASAGYDSFRCVIAQISDGQRILPARLRRDYAVEIQADARARRARVLDPLLQEVYGAPVPATFAPEADGGFRLTWRVVGAPSGRPGQIGLLLMEAHVRRHSGALHLSLVGFETMSALGLVGSARCRAGGGE